MKKHLALPITLVLTANPLPAQTSPTATSCESKNFTLQTLGTGGPIADDERAGSSNIVWIEGKAALMIDAGPGAFLRYGEASLNFADHQAILLTHAHGDHVGGLPGILNSGSFSDRSAPLQIVGPAGTDSYRSTRQVIEAVVGKDGMLSYLLPYLDGSAALPVLNIRDIDTSQTGIQPVLRSGKLEIDAITVHHLDVPALAYIVRFDGKMIVFAGDQSHLSEGFVEALRGSQPDILVMHNAISLAEGQPRGLHRDSRSIGEVAKALSPKLLVLSHNMQRALRDQDNGSAAIRENYAGPMVIAGDLDCFATD